VQLRASNVTISRTSRLSEADFSAVATALDQDLSDDVSQDVEFAHLLALFRLLWPRV
jgi:hypothetical protein